MVMLQQPKITEEIEQKILKEHGNKSLTKDKKKRLTAVGTHIEDGVKESGEVFTPPELVIEILKQLPDQVWHEGKTYLDPTAGDGNFLAAVLIIKMELGHKNPLSTIYGVDIMQDNVDECRQRLLDIAGDTEENRKIVKNNIRCEDGLKYDYSFEPEEDPIEQYKAEARSLPKTKKPKKEPPKTVEVVEDWTKIV